METGSTHERLAERIVKIIVKLNSGKKLSVQELAQEFKTHPRTIQRDFERLEITSLPIVRDEKTKCIYLNPVAMGNYGVHDILHFAKLSGVQNLYPKLNIPFLRGLLNQQKLQTYAAKGYTFEDSTLFTEHFKQLNDAIQHRWEIQFLYKGCVRHVQPYRVIHHHGSWYLAATEQGELKTYRLSRISHIGCSENLTFEHNFDVLERLQNEESIWFGIDKFEVVLSIDSEIAFYFQQRQLLPEQKVIKQLDDGGLLLSSSITHKTQILPLVRYWIPHVKIVNPLGLQEELEGVLKGYLGII